MPLPESRELRKQLSEVRSPNDAWVLLQSLIARAKIAPDDPETENTPYVKFADRTNYTLISNERFETLLTADYLQKHGKSQEAEWLRSLVDNYLIPEGDFYDLNVAYTHGDADEIESKKSKYGFTDKADYSNADDTVDSLGGNDGVE